LINYKTDNSAVSAPNNDPMIAINKGCEIQIDDWQCLVEIQSTSD